uniref:MCM domain-containing protein n=1 Tax=Callorhinchus milii TaxID=7868 RepID=A0A4W3GCQ2_CALMI
CRLLTYSLGLVPRGVRHLASCEIFATVSRDEHGTGTANVQAGSALLAKGGVCYLGELCTHKKDKLQLLQTVLETRSTTVFISGKKFGEDQQMAFPIECNFWALSDADAYPKKTMQREDAAFGLVVGHDHLVLVAAFEQVAVFQHHPPFKNFYIFGRLFFKSFFLKKGIKLVISITV